jgi:DNA-binding NtrC family response regulator
MRGNGTVGKRLQLEAQAQQDHLLVVDDEPTFLSLMTKGLRAEGYKVTPAVCLKEAESLFQPGEFALVLLDLFLKDGDGLSFLRKIMEKSPGQPIVMISGQGTIPLAVEAIKAGARDFLEKPLGLERVLLTVRNTLESVILRQETARLRHDLDVMIEEARQRYQMVGASAVMKQIFALIDRFAPLNTLVLITGESGVGKELAARAIHLNSRCAAGPFKTVNCSSIPDELLESELFGYVKGAFTGAHADKPGLFQAANGGTLFLDEIGDLSLRAQAKVLRAIEYGEVTRVGEVNSEKVDVRLIAATNKDLAKLVEEGKYREDLYYRISGMNLHVPPLRERPEDIPLLAKYFLSKFCQENQLPPKTLSLDADAVLKVQTWKGNVRELLHFIGRLAVLSDRNPITSAQIWQVMRFDHDAAISNWSTTAKTPSLHEARDSFEREYILAALRDHEYNVRHSAVALGIERSQLYRKIEKLGIKISAKNNGDDSAMKT